MCHYVHYILIEIYLYRSLNGSNNLGGSQSSSFPDNSDFPDSAFVQEESPTSSSSSSSSSSSEDSDREWTIKRRGNDKLTNKYHYKKLDDLKFGDMKQNIICVVKHFTPPAISRGSDLYSSLTLIDESDSFAGIGAVFFNRDADRLPHVKREGDILCIHRINVKSFNNQVQLEGTKYTSIVRFSGEVRKKIKPCTGSASFSLSCMERERVRELRKWTRNRRMESQLQTLDSVQPDMYFDLICQVVTVTISKIPRCVVLSVWDGTPHKLQCKSISLEKIYDEGYPLIRENAELLESSTGYTVDVVVYSKSMLKKLYNLFPGKFLYLKNVHSAMVGYNTTVEICIHRKNDTSYEGNSSNPSGITILSLEDELCRGVEGQIEKAMAPITTVPHCTQPLCSIADITSYKETFPAKFHCMARLLGVNAPSLEDLVVIHCRKCQNLQALSRHMDIDEEGVSKEPCSVCFDHDTTHLSSPTRPSCQYYFKMALGDASGTVTVEVGHLQALELLGGIRPNNLYQDQQLRFKLSDLFYSMMGGCNPFTATGSDDGSRQGGRRWLDICVLAVKHNEAVHYCLFDTMLKKDPTPI